MHDHCVIESGTCQIIDVKARVREGRAVESLEAIAPTSSVDALVRHEAALQLIDIKAHVLGGFA